MPDSTARARLRRHLSSAMAWARSISRGIDGGEGSRSRTQTPLRRLFYGAAGGRELGPIARRSRPHSRKRHRASGRWWFIASAEWRSVSPRHRYSLPYLGRYGSTFVAGAGKRRFPDRHPRRHRRRATSEVKDATLCPLWGEARFRVGVREGIAQADRGGFIEEEMDALMVRMLQSISDYSIRPSCSSTSVKTDGPRSPSGMGRSSGVQTSLTSKSPGRPVRSTTRARM